MALRVSDINFVTSPTGLLVPAVTDNPALGNGAADVTFDVVASSSEGWVLTTVGGEAIWAPPSAVGAGVDSIEAAGGGQLSGDVTFSEGDGITLTTAGNDVEISSAGGAMAQLFDSTLGADGPLDTGATIPATYNHLLVIARVRTATAILLDSALLTFNNDTGNNYNDQYMRMQHNVGSGFALAAQPQIQVSAAGNNCAANVFSMIRLVITCYRLTDAFKPVEAQMSIADNTAATGQRTQTTAGLWRSTAAIDRIAIKGAGVNLKAGSRMTVYGML